MPVPFTLIALSELYLPPDGTVFALGNTVTFTLSAPLTNTTTGDVVPAVPIVVSITRAGVLAVTLEATNDPTTSPVGVTYTVVEAIGGVTRSYAIALPYNGGPLVLGLLAPASVAPPVTYGLSSVVGTTPISVSTAAGVATISIDGSGYAATTALTTETTNRTTADSTHAALTTTAHGGIVANSDARLTDSRTPLTHVHSEGDTTSLVTDLAGKSGTAHTHTHTSTTGQTGNDHHAQSHTHSGDGSGTIPNVVAAGASGLLTGADKTKLDGIATGAQVGTVTSAGLSVPGVLFSIGGTPVTGAGTLALSLLTQTANTVLAGPTSGGAATPTMRALVAADVPALAYSTLTGAPAPAGLLRPNKVGYYLGPPCIATTLSKPQAQCNYQPLVLTQAHTLDQLLIETTVAGTSGSVTRLGIYASTSDGLPGALVLDAGTLDTTVTPAILSKTINQALAAGVYWLAAVTQGSPATAPTYRCNGGALPGCQGESAATALVALNGYYQTGVSGALATAAITGAIATSTRIIVRFSA